MTTTDFSQLKNEGKWEITFDQMGGFLIGLLNKAAIHGNVFVELFITKQNTVMVQIFDITGMKYVSLFKREMYQLSPVILKRKLNSMVANEKMIVDSLETELLEFWQAINDRSPTLFKELEQMKLGPITTHSKSESKTNLAGKVELKNVDAVKDNLLSPRTNPSLRSINSLQKGGGGAAQIKKEREKLERQLGILPPKNLKKQLSPSESSIGSGTNFQNKAVGGIAINKSLTSLNQQPYYQAKNPVKQLTPPKQLPSPAPKQIGSGPSLVSGKKKPPKSIMKPTSSLGKNRPKTAVKTEGVRF